MSGQIVRLDEVTAEPSVVTVGFFDGVHRGHQTIIRRAVLAAAEQGLRAVAVTFDRHPMTVLQPGSQPSMLMTAERRLATLLDHRLDRVVVLEFTLELSRHAPERFVDEVLVASLDARRVVVGTNFRFGHRAAGTVLTLSELGTARGFEVEPVGLLHSGELPISSSTIRERLAAGDVAWAREALGRPHLVDGTVVRGQGRGAALGVPTANVLPAADVQLPGTGVYAGHVEVAGRPHPAVVNVGVRPTFGGGDLTVEAHLLDFDGDLYGTAVAVSFEHRIREERRFSGPDDLAAQIRADIARGRSLLELR